MEDAVFELVCASAVYIHAQLEASKRAVFGQQSDPRAAHRILRHALSVKDQVAQDQGVAFARRTTERGGITKTEDRAESDRRAEDGGHARRGGDGHVFVDRDRTVVITGINYQD